MTRKLNAYLRALEKENKAEFTQWMLLQASYTSWYETMCPFMAELIFTDLEKRLFTPGTGIGIYEGRCRGEAGLERAFFAEALATQNLERFFERVSSRQETGRKIRAELDHSIEQARTSKPAADDGVSYPVVLDEARWKEFTEGLARVRTAPEELARAHCAALPSADDTCVDSLALYFFSLTRVPFDE
jgi:hypothetical protein